MSQHDLGPPASRPDAAAATARAPTPSVATTGEMLRLRAKIKASFVPLRLPNFRRYIGGQTVSLAGTFLQSTAQSLLVFSLSGGKAAALGMVALVTAVPLLALSLFSGALVDRFSKRKLLLATQVAEMLLAFTLALLVQTGTVQLWHVYTLAFLLGVCESLVFPAHQTFITELVGPPQLLNALAFNAIVVNSCRVIGPALAGFLIARTGMAAAFWINGSSFIAVVLTLLTIKVTHPAADDPVAAGNGPSSFKAAATIRRIFGDLALKRLFLSVILCNTFGQAIYTLMPALAHGDAARTGALLACAGGGSLISAFIVLPLMNHSRYPGRLLALALAWMGLCLLPVAASPNFWWKAVGLIGAGISTTAVIPTAIGLVQLLVPQAVRGRMTGLMSIVHFGMLPLAAAVLGKLADLSSAENRFHSLRWPAICLRAAPA